MKQFDWFLIPFTIALVFDGIVTMKWLRASQAYTKALREFLKNPPEWKKP